MTTTFKPELLYREDKVILKSESEYEGWAKGLESSLEKAQLLFDQPLTDEEKLEILNQGWNAIERLKRSNSAFPNADINTLLKLEGKGQLIEEVQYALQVVPQRFAAVKFDLKDGKVQVSAKAKKELREKHTYFTKRDDQNDALRIARELSELIEEAISKGFISGLYPRVGISKALNEFIVTKPGEEGLVPNVRKIASL